MTGPSNTNGPRSRPPGESELTAQLITAAGDAAGHLSQEEVDRILGVRPQKDEDEA
ncbi:MAG TPA: hypothetical protein VFR87_05545 [Nocardioidaceae bacterium]|nr:hypothetical protein [Nocardioidaceae bacterium]